MRRSATVPAQERCAGAPGVVNPDVADSCFTAPNGELPVEVARLIGRAVDAGEYEFWVLPGAHGAGLIGGLALGAQLERGQADIRQRKNGSRARRFVSRWRIWWPARWSCQRAGHQPEQFGLISHHPEVADRLGAISDRAGQVRHHPAPVMDQQPPRGQRFDGPAVRPVLSASAHSSATPACDTIPVPSAVTCRPFSQPVVFTY